ncbi:MAG: ATP-binding protein, partial [Planctomycetia bacterium]
ATSSSMAIIGYTPEELIGVVGLDFAHPDDRPRLVAIMEQTSGGRQTCIEWRCRQKHGGWRWVETTARPVFQNGRVKYIACCTRDLTERKQAEDQRNRLEAQIRQAQKMEAVGRLAGAVAHDFNNLLTVIRGYSDLLADLTTEGDPVHDLVLEIGRAGERAEAVTRQLLTLSRRQTSAPASLDLGELVGGMRSMLRSVLGEKIDLVVTAPRRLGTVRSDRGQLEQALLNLVVNARDAMPRGGRLALSLERLELEAEGPPGDAVAGPYLALSVADTGAGLSDKAMEHLFEPFFTTKAAGKGTGLGLATVYNIVRQWGGRIRAENRPGDGVTFVVLLPVDSAAEVEAAAGPVRPPSTTGTETILLVEDDPCVRAVAAQSLRSRGYTVVEAIDGRAGLDLLEDGSSNFDLLLTDVVMPRMTGVELAAASASLHPSLKMLFVSGYADDELTGWGVLATTAEFLQKPFTPAGLAAKVREVLDQRPPNG